MRYAIATLDRYLGVFEAFHRAGWTCVKLFTLPVRDREFGTQERAIALAQTAGAPIQLARIGAEDLQALGESGCEALIVAGYDFKVPPWQPALKYAVNFHPAPLPLGRGPYPLWRALLERQPAWGMTCHRLSAQFDAGDILAAEHFALVGGECHEQLNLRVQMAGKRLAERVARDFVALWDGAEPQRGGSYWPRTALRERMLDVTRPHAEVLRTVRAFGRTGSIAQVSGTWLIVKHALGWAERHQHRPGEVAHLAGNTIVIAVADGYLALIESDIAPPHVVAELNTETRAP